MSTTGLLARSAKNNLQVLTGQDNYNRWVRDFKLVAKAERVWDFYDGTADILTKPDQDDHRIPKFKEKRNAVDANIASSGASASANETAQSANILEANIIQYKLDVEEWKDNDKKVRIAQILFLQWVDPATCRKLEGYDEPKDAWDYLEGQYRMPNACALEIARSKMGRLRFRDCNSMQDYLN